MKQRSLIIWSFVILIGMTALSVASHAQDATNTVRDKNFEAVMSSLHTNNLDAIEAIALGFGSERNELGVALQKILQNPRSSNLSQSVASYYLGVMRFSEAADALAVNIELSLDVSHLIIEHRPLIPYRSAADALVKIGNPSISALIRNLTEREENLARDLSLKALCQIDGDKDIVRLRLQKALKAEKDSQKQARLQAALKALEEIK